MSSSPSNANFHAEEADLQRPLLCGQPSHTSAPVSHEDASHDFHRVERGFERISSSFRLKKSLSRSMSDRGMHMSTAPAQAAASDKKDGARAIVHTGHARARTSLDLESLKHAEGGVPNDVDAESLLNVVAEGRSRPTSSSSFRRGSSEAARASPSPRAARPDVVSQCWAQQSSQCYDDAGSSDTSPSGAINFRSAPDILLHMRSSSGSSKSLMAGKRTYPLLRGDSNV
jgi:hypothetical protein